MNHPQGSAASKMQVRTAAEVFLSILQRCSNLTSRWIWILQFLIDSSPSQNLFKYVEFDSSCTSSPLHPELIAVLRIVRRVFRGTFGRKMLRIFTCSTVPKASDSYSVWSAEIEATLRSSWIRVLGSRLNWTLGLSNRCIVRVICSNPQGKLSGISFIVP